jgi:hypothetical protein
VTDTPSPADLRRAFLSDLAGDDDAAEATYRRALTSPLADPAYRHLIHLLESQHRWAEAADVAREAVSRFPRPELKVTLATLLLGLGQYAEAWPLLEARAQLAAGQVRPNLPYPEWDGRPIRSLTVWDEQGSGDTIQFARFIPDLAARGITVTLFARPELADLFTGLGATVVRAEGKMQIPIADAWAMIGSLPHRLGVTLETLPAQSGYLTASDERRAKWAGKLRPGARVGVVTKGKPGHANDANRSLPYAATAFLLSMPGAESLLPGETRLPLGDFADTAAVIEQLDLVISVDTAVAHLAGAMGKPTWLLLPWLSEDWRWLHDGRTDSPWYPSMTLYRQARPGDWAGVLDAVDRDYQGFVGG